MNYGDHHNVRADDDSIPRRLAVAGTVFSFHLLEGNLLDQIPLRESVSVAAFAAPAKHNRKMILLPEDWLPDEESAAYALRQIGKAEAQDQFMAMRDWALSKNIKRTDWDMTFRRFIRNRKEQLDRRAPRSNGSAEAYRAILGDDWEEQMASFSFHN